MKKITYLFSFSFFLVLAVQAQQVLPITKSEVLSKVLEDNRAIRISEQDYLERKADFRQTNAVFLPNITASHMGMATTNPLMAFGSKLNQGILTASDFNPELLNNPSQIENFSTRIEVQQPLINVDGMYQRQAAKYTMEAQALTVARTSDYYAFEVDKAYMQLQLAYKGVAVLESALKAANENKKLADNSFKQGYLQRADVLAVEVRVNDVKNQLQTAKSNVLNASNYVSFLMHEDGDVIYEPSDALEVDVFTTLVPQELSENRSDIKAMQFATQAYESQNKADKMSFLPRLNAFGSYELYDDQIFQGSASGYLFGAQLSWDVFQGYKRFGKTQKSKAEFEKSKFQYQQYVSQNKLELNKAKRLLLDAENKLKLSKLTVEQSEESLRIRTNRFEAGLEKTTDLLLAETQFAQKQLEYYQTIFEYNYAQSYLQYLTKD